MNTRLTALLAAMVLSLLPAFQAFCQESALDAWLRDDPRGKTYAAAAADLRDVFSRAGSEGLPLGILMDKLREGASKGVPAGRLSAGLEAERQRLLEVRDILKGSGMSIMDAGEYQETLKDISLTLLAGIPAGTIQSLFTAAARAGKTVMDVRAACAALIRMASVSRLAGEDLRRLGEAMVSSSLASSAFASIPSFFIKARASGLREGDVLDSIVIKALQSGGGLARMEELMSQRRKGG